MARPFSDYKANFTNSYTVNAKTGCWEWSRCRHKSGYGKVSYKGRLIGAHRMSYELHHGQVPDGMDVCHSCDNPSCVNPDHLWAGTRSENGSDMAAKGRASRTKLRDEQVLEIRRLVASGKKQKHVAEIFGIGANQVSKIVHRQQWKHL